MNLRLAEGVDLTLMNNAGAQGLTRKRSQQWPGKRFVACDEGRLIATPSGRLLLNRVIEELL